MFSKIRFSNNKFSAKKIVPKSVVPKNATKNVSFVKRTSSALVATPVVPKNGLGAFVLQSKRNFGSSMLYGSSATTSKSKSNFGFLIAAAAAGVFAYAVSNEEENSAYAAEKVPIFGVPGTNKERSFIAIKPDGVHRNYVGEVISRFEQKGWKLVAIKVIVPTKDFAEKHYADLSKKPFFPSLVNYFSSGPVVAMVWEGKDVISGGRSVIGATNPQQATPGTIRGDFAITIGRNMIHGSDSAESAKSEISLWFTEKEVAEYDHALDKWVHEK